MDGEFDGQMLPLAEVQVALPARRGCCKSLESFAFRTYMDVSHKSTQTTCFETRDSDGEQRVLGETRPERKREKS